MQIYFLLILIRGLIHVMTHEICSSFVQVITLYAEYLPTMARGKAILVMSFFWAIGATFEAVLALLTMGPNMGWRWEEKCAKIYEIFECGSDKMKYTQFG